MHIVIQSIIDRDDRIYGYTAGYSTISDRYEGGMFVHESSCRA